MKVLLDTNFLMVPVQRKVDIFEGLVGLGRPELYTISPVIQELQKLSQGKGTDGAAARVALELVEKKGVKIVEADGKADDVLLAFAQKGFTVCTQDHGLQDLLLFKDLNYIYLRQGKYLEKK